MQDVVKLVCCQFDDRLPSNSALLCPVQDTTDCIGISGYALNYFLSAFLNFYQPVESTENTYKACWVVDGGRLYPVVFSEDAGNQYVGVQADHPGLLTAEAIGREACELQKKRKELVYKLKPWETSGEKREYMLHLESGIQDRYTVSDASVDAYHRRMLLMVLIRSIRSSEPRFCSAKNALMLFFDFEATAMSLQTCAERGDSAKELGEFLEKYCSFVRSIAHTCCDKTILPETFRRCFLKCWAVELNGILTNEILLENTDHSTRQEYIIPQKRFEAVEEFIYIVRRCFFSATYERRVKQMQKIREALLGHLSADERLPEMQQYIEEMTSIRQRVRRHEIEAV